MREPAVHFVAHTLDRSGAPMWLLTFLRWANAHAPGTFRLTYAGSAELVPDFAQLCPVTHVDEPPSRPGGPEVVYANSAWAHRYLDQVVQPGDVVVSHVHELPLGLRGIDVPPAAAVPSHYVAAADCVRQNLVAHHSLDPGKVTTIHSFIDVVSARRPRKPSESPTVVAVGSLNPYKGPDLFLEVARRFRERHSATVGFQWIGGVEPQLSLFRNEVRHQGLSETVTVVGHVDDVPGRLAQATVFLLASREDPCPLVCLEAAALAVPIVAFEQGGAPEFLTSENLVPAFDVDGACDLLHEVIEANVLTAATGTLVERVKTFDVEVLAPRVWQVIAAAYDQLAT